MPGLFIQRQAEALAKEHQVVVLYLHPEKKAVNEVELDYAEEHGVEVIRVYFRAPAQYPGFLYQIALARRYQKALSRGIEALGDFFPDVIHSHVLTRIPYLGHRLAKKWKVPHVISEHWSRYFPDNGTYKGIVRKIITRHVAHHAAALLPVSEVLQEAMHFHGIRANYEQVIPNIVDFKAFPCKESRRDERIKRIIHVSCVDDASKNISGLIAAVQEVLAFRKNFQLLIVGEGPDLEAMKRRVKMLGLYRTIFFTGLKTGENLVHLYQSADFSVLCSRYETFGMVIPESLACGTPVVSTYVGIAPEIITPENGLLVNDHHPKTLARDLNRMLESLDDFDPVQISHSIKDIFSPDTVVQKLNAVYKNVTHEL